MKKSGKIKISLGGILPKWSSKNVRQGSYSLGLCVVVIAIVVVLNMIISELPSKYTSIDLSDSKIYSIGEETENIVKALDEDVTLYLVAESGSEDTTILQLLEKYEELSSHLKVEQKDPVVNPGFVSQYSDSSLSSNSIIIVSEKRSKVVPYNDMYETSFSYSSYSYQTTGFDGEGQITSAIDYVMSDNLPVMYVLTGHEEFTMTDAMKSLVEKQNIEMQDLTLLTAESVPEDADCLFIYAPQKDISAEEAEKIIAYLEGGGKAFIISAYTGEEMPNFASVLANYGLAAKEGVVLDGDMNHYISGNPMYLVPDVQNADAAGSLAGSGTYILMPIAQGIEKLESCRDTISITSLLATSDSAYIKADTENMTTMEKESGDESGSFDLAVSVTENYNGNETKIIYMTSPYLFDDQIDAMVSGGNTRLLANGLSWMCGMESTVSIPSKSLTLSYLTVTAGASRLYSMLTIMILPVIFLGIGGMVWYRRRKR